MNKTKKEKNTFNLKKFKFKEKSLDYLLNNDISNAFKNKLNSKRNTNNKKQKLEIHTNSFNSLNKKKLTLKSNLKRNKTAKFLNVFPHKELSEEEKIKMTMILKNFTKNKLATEELFKIEKKLPLNSINQSSFNFINNEDYKEKNNSKQNHNIKNLEKSFSHPNLLASSMIDKFNNKTNEILDKPLINRIKYSKNIFKFRKQIINNFTEQENHLGNIENSKDKYRNALDYFDKTKDIQIKKFIKSEEQFYKLRNKEIGLYEIDTNDEQEDNADSINNNTRLYSFKSSKNLDVNNFDDEEHINKNINKTFKSRAFSSKNVLYDFKSFSSPKNILKNGFDKQNSKNLAHNLNEKNFERKEGNKPSSKKINSYNSINYEIKFHKNNNNKIYYNLNKFYNYKNQSKNNKSQIPIFKSRSEQKVFNLKKNFLLFQKKKIVERSKKFAESMANMYFFQYNPKNYIDYKNATMNINTKNLTKVIKLNRINKYLCDVEDDDLLVMNSNKLRDLMKQAEIQYYLCNKKDFQLSYLRKNLKPQTLNKFSRIKNSFFGFPC